MSNAFDPRVTARQRDVSDRAVAGARMLAAGMVAASALALPTAHAQSGGNFRLFLSLGQAVATADIPVSSERKAFIRNDDDQLDILLLVFGAYNYTVSGNFDPYFAARVQITNLTNASQPVGLSISMPMEPVPTPTPYVAPFPTFTGLFTVELKDTNGDGSATYTGGGAGFNVFDVLGRRLTANHSVALAAPGKTTVYDIAPLALTQNGLTGQWVGMEFLHHPIFPAVSSLSPGDSVEFYAFGCVALPGTSCPAPPDLSLSAVPEAHVYALMLVGLGALAFSVRRRRDMRLA